MSAALLDAVIIEPKHQANACAIWLHGLGADGHDFANVIPSLNLPSFYAIRFIFPHAPQLPVTINNGMIMPAWYDISAIDLDAVQDAQGLRRSEQAIRNLIAQAMTQGIESDRIFLIGFSQGGALALHTALRFEEPLAGVAALSSYLPLHKLVETEKHTKNNNISIFMGHGYMDPVVPYWMGQKSCTDLQKMGYVASWHPYTMPHTVCLQELSDLGKWIRECLE